jgi:hypothetical protein
MTSRRQFLQIGLGAAAAVPVAGLSAAQQPAAFAPLPLFKVVYDLRFPSSVAFARRAAAQGLATHATQGDITSFWYHELYHRWADSPVAIAGLTGYGALFCLERLAWDQRLRVVLRAEHAPAGRRVAHGFAGPAEVLPAACSAVADDDWAARMAEIVAACPTGRGVGAEADVRVTSTGAMAESETLYSWVIAAPLRG